MRLLSGYVVCFILCLITAFLLIGEHSRSVLKSMFQLNHQIIIAKLTKEYDGEKYEIVKLSTNDRLAINIYKNYKLVDSFDFFRNRNTQFMNKHFTSELFSTDMDQDNVEEIVVPFMDRYLISQNGFIKYNNKTRSFYKVKEAQ